MRHSRNSFSRFIPILLVIVITIVAVAAVVAIGQSLFGGNDESSEVKTTVTDGRAALLSPDVGRSVRLTVRGPIVADEKFRSYDITISSSSRVMTTYEGYLEKQLDQKKFDNNTRAYEELIYSLDKRKMMDGTELTDDKNDLRGICASGKIYKFETIKDSEVVKSLWTSDCSGSKGSAKANVAEILDMFLKQIPDGQKMAAEIGLGHEETFFKL